MVEIKIRVRPIIKEKLVELKEKTGLSINFQINFAIFKYLILDTKVPYWVLDTRPNPNYDVINKLPEELKFCDGGSCELPFNEKETYDEWLEAKQKICKHINKTSSSDPYIWDICQDCGTHFNGKGEVIPFKTYDSRIRGDKC